MMRMKRRRKKFLKTIKVLIISNAMDAHVPPMIAELDHIGQPWVCVDPGDFPGETSLSALFTSTSHDIFVSRRLQGQKQGYSFAFEDIGSIWYRRPHPILAPTYRPELERRFVMREGRAGFLGLLRGLDALWVNHPDALREASYKARQLMVAQRHGLMIPDSILTNDPATFLSFYEAWNGEVIYKLLGFPWYDGIQEDDPPVSMYTSVVTSDFLAHAARVSATAHLFQHRVKKRCDIKVVIIGQECFATEIYPDSRETEIDIRRDYTAVHYAPHQLPRELRTALHAIVKQYRLQFATIDLLLTPEGSYIFLEINASGQFGWLVEAAGLPLYTHLAHVLALRT